MIKSINFNKKLKLMVALDLTDMDTVLLNYVSFLDSVWDIEHIYFIHNIKQSELIGLYDEFLEEEIEIEDIVNRSLKKTIKKNYTASVPHSLLITSDDYTEGILSHLAGQYKIDILIAGNKNELQGTGAVNRKLVRMLRAHLLLIPEEAGHSLKNVLVPTDFSTSSARSIKGGISLASRSGGKIEGLHIYSIPSVFFPYINTEKAIDKTQKHLEERIKQFRSRHKLPASFSIATRYRKDHSVAEAIERYAEKGSFDIIVVSVRGGSKIKALFVGSITNDLLTAAGGMPLLILQ